MNKKLIYIIIWALMITAFLPAIEGSNISYNFYDETQNNKKSVEPNINPIGSFVEWEKIFDTDYYSKGSCVQQTSDGGFICIGHGFGYDIWLIKTDDQGNMQWDKRYDWGNIDYGWYVLETDDSGFILLGENPDHDVWLIKTDKYGNEEWNRTHGPKMINSGRCIQKTNDGGYIIAGWTSPYNWLNCHDPWILKVDSMGFEEWNKTFENPVYSKSYSVKQTPDNGYIIAGGKAYTSDGNSDIWLIKTDTNGNVMWDKTFGDSETWNMARSIDLTFEGGFITAGENLLIKTDELGNEIWSIHIQCRCVQQTKDGGFIVTGSKKMILDHTNMRLTKIDNNGIVEWERTFGGIYDDYGNFVQQTKDGGYILIGIRRSHVPGYGKTSYKYIDLWIVKTGEKPRLSTIDIQLNDSFDSMTPFLKMRSLNIESSELSEFKYW